MVRSGPVVSFPGQTNVYVCTRRHARKVEHRRQATPLLPATGDTACDRARTCSGGFQTMHPCNPHQPIPYSQNNRMQCCRCTAPELSNGRRFDSSPFCTTPPASTTQKVHRAEQERERETDHHPPAAFMPGRVTSPSICAHTSSTPIQTRTRASSARRQKTNAGSWGINTRNGMGRARPKVAPWETCDSRQRRARHWSLTGRLARTLQTLAASSSAVASAGHVNLPAGTESRGRSEAYHANC